MKVLLIDNGTNSLPQLQAIFSDDQVVVTPFEKLTEHNLDSYDLIVVSGGHKYAVMSHQRQYARELQLIRTCRKPLLGICLGLELIVTAFGGRLKLLRQGVHRLVSIHFIVDDPIGSAQSTYRVFENHRRGIKELPPALQALARSHYGIEVIRHSSLPIYAFQFHPEAEESSDGRLLIERAVKEVLTKVSG